MDAQCTPCRVFHATTQIMGLRDKVSDLEHKLAKSTAEELHLQRMLLKAQEVIVRLSQAQGPSTFAANDPTLREMMAQVLPGGRNGPARDEFCEQHLEQLEHHHTPL